MTQKRGQKTLESFLIDKKKKANSDYVLNPNTATITPTLQDTRIDHKKPKKSLIIKSFKVKPTVNANYEQETWKTLEAAVVAIQAQRPVPFALEELYRACENLCHQKKQESIYNKLVELIRSHIFKQLETLKKSMKGNILETIDEYWSNHCRQIIMIRNVFLYLDRTFLLASGLKCIWDLGLEFFRDIIMLDPSIKQMHLDALLQEINNQRDGKLPSEYVHRSTKMLSSLSIYFTEFEKPFIKNSERYYSEKAMELSSKFDTSIREVANYLVYISNRFEKEKEYCTRNLDASTKNLLIDAMLKELVEKYANHLVQFTKDLLSEKLDNELGLLYELLQNTGQLELLKAKFCEYIQENVVAIVQDPQKDANMITSLLDFKQRLDQVLKSCFGSNEPFAYALKESFEISINKRPNKPAELIAKTVDKILKSKGLLENEVDEQLDRCLDLFRFTEGKDVFEAFYGKDLAKRLLLQKSASVDAEKNMLSKLKSQCGAGFTNKLEGMFKDIELSKDVMTSFRQSARAQEKLGKFEANVYVLTSGFWPTYPVTQMVLPPEGEREFVVSLYQAVILLLFNKESRISYSDIKSNTGIEASELCRTLQSLACGKVRVLSKIPRGRDVLPDDQFEFNAAFTHSLYRITINSIQAKETEQEQKQTNDRVFEDRQYQVDAAIVRIMKARKQCMHKTLVSELFSMLKFAIQPKDLKIRIESLIERDYIERDDKDPQLYIYLA